DVALGPITVDYATSNLTATAGQDYQAVSGTLAFNQNETVKAISIPILRDGSVVNNTSFAVTLSNLSGGAMLARASTTVNLLDAYSKTGAETEAYMQFRPLAESRGFLYCYPDGTKDRWGNPFWNATDGCCDFGSTGVDDVRYLRGLIEETGRQFVVDRKRVYLVGHSNGGFMAYRMDCETSDIIAGIASLAGVTFLD